MKDFAWGVATSAFQIEGAKNGKDKGLDVWEVFTHEPDRIEFLDAYLGELMRAKRDGIDVRGYFLWTLMDNFEWARGYEPRFGIVYTDYETGERIPKDSAFWYSDFIKNHS